MQRGAGLGVPLASLEVLGDQELGVEDGPLGVGRLRPVGKLGQVALAGGDRLVELLLPLEDLADLELRRHQQSGPLAARLVVAAGIVPLEEGFERGERLLALAPGEVRRADLVGGADGQRMRRIRGQQPPEGGDAEVQLGVVGRGGDAVGPGDPVQGAGADVGGRPRCRPSRGRGPGRSR